jgi:hypothetical protein
MYLIRKIGVETIVPQPLIKIKSFLENYFSEISDKPNEINILKKYY